MANKEHKHIHTGWVGRIGYPSVLEKQAFAEGENVRNQRCLRSGAKPGGRSSEARGSGATNELMLVD